VTEERGNPGRFEARVGRRGWVWGHGGSEGGGPGPSIGVSQWALRWQRATSGHRRKTPVRREGEGVIYQAGPIPGWGSRPPPLSLETPAGIRGRDQPAEWDGRCVWEEGGRCLGPQADCPSGQEETARPAIGASSHAQREGKGRGRGGITNKPSFLGLAICWWTLD